MHTLERFFMSSLLCSQGCSRTLWLWSLFSAYDTITSSAFWGVGRGGWLFFVFFLLVRLQKMTESLVSV